MAQMIQTDATLMWCKTTPVPEGELGRFEGDAIIYNDEVEDVMTTNGVLTNDLHAYALLEVPGIQKAYGDVHFTAAGYVYLGKQVAREIYGILPGVAVEDFNFGSQANGAELSLSWTADPGVTYSVMTTTNLATGPWTQMSDEITGEGQVIGADQITNEGDIAGEGPVTVTITRDLLEGQQFYQVIADME